MIYRFQEACLAGKWGISVLQVLQACSVFTNLSLEHNRLEINLQYVYHALLSFGMAHPLSTLIHYAMFAVTISSPDHAYCVGHKWAGTGLPCSQQIGFTGNLAVSTLMTASLKDVSHTAYLTQIS